MTSSLIRLEDKQRRLENLVLNGNQQVDESIDDTLLDIAGYAVLTMISRGNEHKKIVLTDEQKEKFIKNKNALDKWLNGES